MTSNNIQELATTNPEQFENEFVTKVYNDIAPHFSLTRYKPWPFVEQFLKTQASGSIVADIGCGNGKYLGVNKELCMIGSDISESLINICCTKGFECAVADGMYTSFRSNAFDAVISIAVIHHFSTNERRLSAVRELVRICKPGGKVLIYVWAMEQAKQKYTDQDVFVPWQLQKRFHGYTQTATENNVDKQPSGEMVYKRYYHMFKQGELEQLVLQLDNVAVETTLFEHENWVIVVTKTK